MSCGCDNAPCAPAPFLCQCERDCWNGPPDEYEACMDACDPGCDFPEFPGYPSEGYLCPDGEGTEEDYAECLSDCDDAVAAAIAVCEAMDFGTPRCACEAAVLETVTACDYDCEIAALPGRIDCAQAAVNADETCCDTPLATCYEPCENAYLDAIAPVEEAFYSCERDAYIAYYASGSTYDEESGSCDFPGSAEQSLYFSLLSCKRQRIAARLPHLQTRRICRATCERDEIRRHAPEERKRAECGSRLHLCQETCAAAFMFSRAECILALDACIVVCDPTDDGDDCRSDCYRDYYGCYAEKQRDNVFCRYDCCAQEHAHPPNLRLYDPCHLACWEPAFADLTQCAADHLECDAACDGDSDCLAACDTVRATCETDARDAFEDCLDLDCGDLRKDCPLCADEAIVGGCDDGSSSATSDEGTADLPPQPACE